MSERDKTCEEKIDEHLKGRIEDAQEVLKAEDPIEALNELALALSKTEVYKLELSYGGRPINPHFFLFSKSKSSSRQDAEKNKQKMRKRVFEKNEGNGGFLKRRNPHEVGVEIWVCSSKPLLLTFEPNTSLGALDAPCRRVLIVADFLRGRSIHSKTLKFRMGRNPP
ncbi:MAG: hypothetical protein QXT67_04790 [Candidatus Bathyarchaeia archaeon]